jgi:hypothetical protein
VPDPAFDVPEPQINDNLNHIPVPVFNEALNRIREIERQNAQLMQQLLARGVDNSRSPVYYADKTQVVLRVLRLYSSCTPLALRVLIVLRSTPAVLYSGYSDRTPGIPTTPVVLRLYSTCAPLYSRVGIA